MPWTKDRILKVLDDCCDNFTFPMLDNGYVYLAASRLSAFRSVHDWQLAIEEGKWIGPGPGETVNPGECLVIRGSEIAVPKRDVFQSIGIPLEHASNIYIYELCRALAMPILTGPIGPVVGSYSGLATIGS